MHIVMLAPVSARSLAARFDEDGRRVARSLEGNYGAAPTALVAALLDAGATVTVVTHRRGEPAISLSGERLNFVQVASRASARAQALDGWREERRDMRNAVKQADPDIVHAHWTYEWALAGIQSRFPLLITVRDAPLTILRYYPDIYRVLRTVLAYRVRIQSQRSVMTAVSPYMGRAWRRQMAWSKTMPIIPNIVPIDVARTAARSETPVIVEVADSGPRKNVRGLLKAFSLVRAAMPETRLILLGHGLGGDGAIAAWARERQLEDGVTFRGAVDRDEVATQLSTAWVHTHAAFEESFGNTLLEAMAIGTPVIGGYRSAAVPWVLDNGAAGVLTDVRHPRRFADDIVSLLRDDAKREKLAAVGLDRVRAKFSPATVAAQHLALYGELSRKTAAS
jgi:glycosyltransferase involved in cell wall biosynthesis